MSAFRAITGEEEAATAIFHALKRHGYDGAKKLKPANHLHKAAVVPFLQAAGDFLSTAIARWGHSFNLRWNPDDPKGKLELRLRPLDPAITTQIFSELPLQFDVKVDGVPYDFTAEIQKVADAHAKKNIHKLIRARAERRYAMLYASPQGIPSINLPIDGPLTTSRDRILATLAVFLFIDQHAAVQLLPQQALTAFLAILPKLDPSLLDNAT